MKRDAMRPPDPFWMEILAQLICDDALDLDRRDVQRALDEFRTFKAQLKAPTPTQDRLSGLIEEVLTDELDALD